MAEHGIRLDAVALSVIVSGMNHSTGKNPELWAYHLQRVPLNRLGAPAYIANMATFLASDEASWLTGKMIEVGGGHVF